MNKFLIIEMYLSYLDFNFSIENCEDNERLNLTCFDGKSVFSTELMASAFPEEVVQKGFAEEIIKLKINSFPSKFGEQYRLVLSF